MYYQICSGSAINYENVLAACTCNDKNPPKNKQTKKVKKERLIDLTHS